MSTTEGVPAEPRIEPKIKAILEVMRPGGELEQAEKKNAEALSGVGHVYKRFEKDMHGNRGAISLIRRMDKMSADKRGDFLRTLEPLLVERGYTLDAIDPDLVAQAEGEPAAAPSNGVTGESDENDQGEDEPDKPQTALGSALEKAKNHMTGGKGYDAETAPGTEKPKRAKPKLGVVHGGAGVTH